MALISDKYIGPNDSARLISPVLPVSTSGYCLKWYFHMWGSVGKGELTVKAQSKEKSSLLWRFSQSVGNEWHLAQADIFLPNDYKDFSLVIEGKSGVLNKFVTAIDDLTLEEGPCRSIGSCDFEDGYCTWENVKDERDDFNWELATGETASQQTGPSFDHTTGDSSGVFLFIEASYPSRVGQRAMLESQLFQATPSYGLCLNFWYHMYGRQMGSLNVYAYSISNETTLLWALDGDKGNEWRNGRVNIKSTQPFKLIIEGVRGSGVLSDIGIDDINVIERPCSIVPYDSLPDKDSIKTTMAPLTTRTFKPTTLLDCTFEQNMCTWVQTGSFNWTRSQGTQGSELDGPIEFDHTIGTAEGWYLFADLKNRSFGDKAIVETPTLTGLKCMSFYYYIQAPSVNVDFDLNVKLLDKIEWRRTSYYSGDFWRAGRLTVGSLVDSKRSYKVSFEVMHLGVSSGTANVGIDDIYFIDGPCVDSSDIDETCTFSNGNLCGYTFNSDSQLTWDIYDPSKDDTSEIGPVPLNDHTSAAQGSGYVYAETKGLKSGETALMTSRVYDVLNITYRGSTDQMRCLEFYYWMNGKNTAKLNVRAETPETNKKFPLWSRDYEHGGIWWKGFANIGLLSKYKIVFEAEVGPKPDYGLIGLDDITLRNGPCSSLAGTCDFDNKDLCNWMTTKELDVELDWQFRSGPTPSSILGTGPFADHTLATRKGYYLYLESSSPAREGWKARIISEPMVDSNTGCIDFWYHMRGRVSCYKI